MLGGDAIGRLVLTATAQRPTRIRDIVLRCTAGGWVVGGADLRTTVQAVLGANRRCRRVRGPHRASG